MNGTRVEIDLWEFPLPDSEVVSMATIREEFVKFITKGNLVQMAVAFVMGIAFSALITALVGDIFTPLIGVAGKFDFASWRSSVNGSTSSCKGRS